MNACTCGHAEDEHGGDPKFPGSSMCIYNPNHSKFEPDVVPEAARECDCVAFEEDS